MAPGQRQQSETSCCTPRCLAQFIGFLQVIGSLVGGCVAGAAAAASRTTDGQEYLIKKHYNPNAVFNWSMAALVLYVFALAAGILLIRGVGENKPWLLRTWIFWGMLHCVFSIIVTTADTNYSTSAIRIILTLGLYSSGIYVVRTVLEEFQAQGASSVPFTRI